MTFIDRRSFSKTKICYIARSITVMIKDKKTVTTKDTIVKHDLFDRENYIWMLIGAAVLTLGFFLMSGGKSDNPSVFNEKEIYSHMRITVAPLLIIAGFVIEIFAIMKKPKHTV
jgi:hypothetical protein